jgi:hypothetical protein
MRGDEVMEAWAAAIGFVSQKLIFAGHVHADGRGR